MKFPQYKVNKVGNLTFKNYHNIKRRLIHTNLKINKEFLVVSKGFLLLLNFRNLVFLQLISIFCNLINLPEKVLIMPICLNKTCYTFNCNSSSKSILFYCVDNFVTFLFLDLLLKYRIVFFLKNIFSIEEFKFTSLFEINQLYNFGYNFCLNLNKKKAWRELGVFKLYVFQIKFIIKIFYLLKNVKYTQSVF